MTPRYTIGGLLGLVVLCGIGFAALRAPSPLWANVLYTAAVGSLMTAAVNVAFARGARRKFWGGFAVCGGAYFAMCFVPPFKEDMCLRMVTTPILEVLYAKAGPPAGAPTNVNATWLNQLAVAVDLNAAGGTPASVTNANVGQLAQSYILTNPAPGGGAPANTIFWQGPGTLSIASPPSAWSAWTGVDPNDGSGLSLGNVALATTLSYRWIGHSLFVLLIGLIGGVLTRRAFPDPTSIPAPTGPAS